MCLTTVKNTVNSGIGKVVSVVSVGLFTLSSSAQAAFTAPDMSGTVTDMGTAFAAVLLLVVAALGFKYIKRMFA